MPNLTSTSAYIPNTASSAFVVQAYITDFNYTSGSGQVNYSFPDFQQRTCIGVNTTFSLVSNPSLPSSVTYDGQFILTVNSSDSSD